MRWIRRILGLLLLIVIFFLAVGTRVTWILEGEVRGNPVERWVGMCMGLLTGPEFEESLLRLAEVVEESPVHDSRFERNPNFEKRVPEGDNRMRLVCEDCGFIHYDNPRVVVGAVAEYEGTLLLGRRAIPPRLGFWNVPAGFLEIGESPEEGARREVLEETGAHIEILDLLGVYSVDRIARST